MGKNSRGKPPRRGKRFFFKWLKAVFLEDPRGERLKARWIIPAKAARAADRSRLRRWGRENLRETELKGDFVFFLSQKAARGWESRRFYKTLRRREFDHVFRAVLEKSAALKASSPAKRPNRPLEEPEGKAPARPGRKAKNAPAFQKP